MTLAHLEHANITVSDPDATAQVFQELFDWKIRWAGESMDSGYTVHVGTDQSYLALYAPPYTNPNRSHHHATLLNFNHIAVVVSDYAEAERRAQSLGLEPFNHGNYEPGRRFYIKIRDELEIEVVNYAD